MPAKPVGEENREVMSQVFSQRMGKSGGQEAGAARECAKAGLEVCGMGSGHMYLVAFMRLNEGVSWSARGRYCHMIVKAV